MTSKELTAIRTKEKAVRIFSKQAALNYQT